MSKVKSTYNYDILISKIWTYDKYDQFQYINTLNYYLMEKNRIIKCMNLIGLLN